MEINKNLVVIKENNKEDKFSLLDELCNLLYRNKIILSKENFFEIVKSREEDMSTGFGYGLAIPHGRSNEVNTFDFAIMLIQNGVDYNAIDGKPVNIIFLAAIPSKEGKLYQTKLSRISSFFRDKNNRDEIFNVKDKTELIKILERI